MGGSIGIGEARGSSAWSGLAKGETDSWDWSWPNKEDGSRARVVAGPSTDSGPDV